MKPSASMPRFWRIAILVLALAATLGVATAAASPAHIHADSTGSTCEICFTAHTVSYEVPFAIAIPAAPLAEAQDFVTCGALSGYQTFLGDIATTRGPPSSSH